MTVTVWTLAAAVWVALFAGCLAGWRLRGSIQARRLADAYEVFERGMLA